MGLAVAGGSGHLTKAIIREVLGLPFFNGLQKEAGHEFGCVALGVIGRRSAAGIAEIYGKPTSGVIKDTVVVPMYARAVVDFTADQPGPALFHCHIQHHMDYGFKALLTYASVLSGSDPPLLSKTDPAKR